MSTDTNDNVCPYPAPRPVREWLMFLVNAAFPIGGAWCAAYGLYIHFITYLRIYRYRSVAFVIGASSHNKQRDTNE